MCPADIKRAVTTSRLPGESRLGQSNRLHIPYVTLRRMEEDGYIHRNPHLRAAYLKALGLSEAKP